MPGLSLSMPNGTGGKEACPVLDNPEPDCYCLNLTSLTIPKAIQFCLRDFRDCPIYQRFKQSREDDTADVSCPLLEDPAPDCYFKNMTSLAVPQVVRFCIRGFKNCPIYRRHVEGAQS